MHVATKPVSTSPFNGFSPVGKRWRPTRSESPAGDVFGVRMCTCTNGGVLVGFRCDPKKRPLKALNKNASIESIVPRCSMYGIFTYIR